MRFMDFDVLYAVANVAEQIDAWPGIEPVDRISYDEERTGREFSFGAGGRGHDGAGPCRPGLFLG